jgi:hypothetical protein
MTEVITKADLEIFKEELRKELLQEINQVLSSPEKLKGFVNATEARNILGIHRTTLMRYRSKKLVSFKKVGKSFYYDKKSLMELNN